MTDTGFLADQLRRAHQGQAWHGPSLSEVLNGVTAETAGARPIAGAHTIWELVRHIGAWLGTTGRMLDGESVNLSAVEDWPAHGTGETDWQQALAALHEQTQRLEEQIANLPQEALRKGVPGREFFVRFLLEGVIQHHLYHAGQIAILKKAAQR